MNLIGRAFRDPGRREIDQVLPIPRVLVHFASFAIQPLSIAQLHVTLKHPVLFEHVRAVSAKKQTSVEWGSASELSTHFFHGDQGSTDPPNSAIVYIEAGFQNRGCVLVLSPTGSRADANLPH